MLISAVTCAASPALGGAATTGACPSPITGLGSGTVYYVSPSGSDGNSGTSTCNPWQTVTKVDASTLLPGDTVAFQGGQTFTTALAPWSGTRGNGSQPIFYTSYGNGRAVLSGGVYLNSVAYLTFDGLAITDAAGPGIGTGAGGSGVTDVVVRNSSISSSYVGGIGGYGIGLRNPADARWTIANDEIADTADSGVAFLGSHVTVENNVLTSNGVGPYCGTASGQNPCHGIYAKGPDAIITGNTITDPQTVGVSLRYQDNIVLDNTISGGQRGIAFSSETTIPGTTYLLGNTISGQSDTAIQTYAGTSPLYESLVIASNTIYRPVNYGLYLTSGPNSATTQIVTLADNLVELGGGGRGYLNLASPVGYTKTTYTEHFDAWHGAGGSNPFVINGVGRTWSVYTSWFGGGTEGTRDLSKADPLLNPSAFTLAPGSPAIGAGTTAVPGITYRRGSTCPAAPSSAPLQWQYCASAPDMGSH